MTACLLVGTQFFLVLGSIWKTCARVLKMGCSLCDGRHGDPKTSLKAAAAFMLQIVAAVYAKMKDLSRDFDV